MRKLSVVVLSSLLISCGDFPSYSYDQSEDYCVMDFPFAGGLIGRKYVGYFYITSTLQYLDHDPEVEIFIGGPSGLDMEVGSVQKVEIDDQTFFPKFHKSYLQGELQYLGPAFTFTKSQSEKIFQALQDGYDLSIHGRLEVGKQYETEIYNFFFDSNEAPFRSCINRLLNEEDLEQIAERKRTANTTSTPSS
ncbi:hypothetical protein FLL45_00915 [Aliikangiella marina]|uniref:Lipoprotein n=1 Tax=Aliikangiella marina TaxID=1712262 RepID=A0A545TH68_9GAMM|nr:hypothetical protein [Aliikangiella marina]TQV76555.1 hypothetical protein FLL45_00915 [Aliikangiella marina]